MKRKIINYSTSSILTIIFFIVGILGILIFPGFLKIFGMNLSSLPKVQMYKIHHLLGVFLIVSLFVHITLHWNWMGAFTKKYLIKSNKKMLQSKKQIGNYIINIALLIMFFLLIITGIIKFPGFLTYFDVGFSSIPLNEISFVHDWSGVVFFFLTIIHMILFLNRLISRKIK